MILYCNIWEWRDKLILYIVIFESENYKFSQLRDRIKSKPKHKRSKLQFNLNINIFLQPHFTLLCDVTWCGTIKVAICQLFLNEWEKISLKQNTNTTKLISTPVIKNRVRYSISYKEIRLLFSALEHEMKHETEHVSCPVL